MPTILSDHNCEKHAQYVFFSLIKLRFVELLDLRLLRFRDVNLPVEADDKTVWQYCQDNGYYLLTGNRSTKDDADSLHEILNRFAGPSALPVLTFGNLERVLNDEFYCEACAEALAEIILDDGLYIGTPRLYIPW